MKIWKPLLIAAGLLALAASPALAYEPGTWVLRAGVGNMQPKSNNLTVLVEDEIISEICVDVRDATSMTFSGTYMINEKWAFDVFAAWPFNHDIRMSIDESEYFKFAETDQIPPTFSFQYHFLPDGDFQPYAGLGLNWTTFSSTKLVENIQGVPVDWDDLLGLSIDDSFGIAAQLGGDWRIGDHWVMNFDVRWMDIEADAHAIWDMGDGVTEREKLDPLKIDPFVYSINLGYHF